MNKKRILSALLAVCMVFGMMLYTRADVSAKSADGIRIVFNGKNAVSLNSGSEPETLSQIERK